MTPAEVAAALEQGAVPVDTRPLQPFAAGHLPGAVHVEFNLADLAERAEMLLPRGLAVIVHAEPQRTVEASVGLLEDAGLRVLGHLAGGLAAWSAEGRPLQGLRCIDVDELHGRRERYLLLDVRERYEFVHGHLAGARLLPSGEAWAAAEDAVPRGQTVAVFCSGYGRAAFAASALARRGVETALVLGGMYEWQRHGYPVVVGA